MVVEAPPAPTPEPAVEDGVIEDARRRQQRHRQFGALLLSLVAAAALIAGLAAGHGGGGGSGSGDALLAKPAGGSSGGAAGHASESAFPGAPATQPNEGVVINACPLAKPNRYLPARAGCVTVRSLDMNARARPDLVIIYSVLSRRHPYWYNGGAPKSIANDFEPLRAYLKVVLPDGTSTSTRIASADGARAALLDAAARVNDDQGDELFLLIGRTSSGATDMAYGLHHGRLIPAGVLLGYGGDSATRTSFDCVAGTPPRLIQRAYELIGPTIYAWWKETTLTYAWRGPRLVRVSSRRFKEYGAPKDTDPGIGQGCVQGIA